MKNSKQSSLVLLSALILSAFAVSTTSQASEGEVPVAGLLLLHNDHVKSVWITTYDDISKAHIDSGCVKAGDTQSFGAAFGPFGDIRVRAQVTEDANCSDRVILCDTDAELANNYNKNAHMVVKYSNGDETKCYLDKE